MSMMFPVHGLAVMSIDLGTEFMKIAIVKPGIPMEIVLNKESRRKTPVIVAIKEKDREFGEAALSRSSRIPAQSYMFLRELVGKSLNNPVIQQYLKRFPYYKLKLDNQTNELVFEHDSETNYTVEELLAMIFKKAREYANDFSEQLIDSAVITVPPYFTQSERRAVKRVCELANIKLLQLINHNTAVALNYGMFRYKDFNATGSTYLFYDMGSQSTTCTIVTYNIVKSKERGHEANVPQLIVKSVAFDRDLGGLEFQIRLRDYFAKQFHKQHPKLDLYKNPKALIKLFYEAERAKHVLSANNEYVAQIEGLIDDIDFKHRLTREDFENLSLDLFERVKKPIKYVLETSGINLNEIQQVILFGGSTRIPRVQTELSKALGGIELGKSLNTDEAAALGAVYQAAALTKGYRVKKFIIKDTNQYPINVKFERQNDNSKEKLVDRTLFDRNNLYPNRKLMTFNKHLDDFSFDIHYSNLTYLPSVDERALGQTDLLRINVIGVRTAYDKHKDTYDSKGIKAHFKLDDNCLIVLDRIEFAFQKKENESDRNEAKTKEENQKSILSKIGSKILSIFSSKTTVHEIDNAIENLSDNNPETITSDQFTTNNDKRENNSNESSTLQKTNNVREPLKFKIELLDYPEPSSSSRENSVKKLSDLDAHDLELAALGTAKNNLETFIYDTRDKLESNEVYKKSSTNAERVKINEKLTEIYTWLLDEGAHADVKTLKSKLDQLKTLTRPIEIRIREIDLRPKKIQELTDLLNVTENFVQLMRQVYLKAANDDRPFPESEIKYLEKLVKDTYIWRDQAIKEFEKLSSTDTPKHLSTDINEKINALKRQSNYLFTKAQTYVPKSKTSTTKTEPTKEEANFNGDKSSTTTDTTSEATDKTKATRSDDKYIEL